MTARPAWMTEELLKKAVAIACTNPFLETRDEVAVAVLLSVGPDIARWGVEQAAKVVEEPANPADYTNYPYPAQTSAVERHRYEKHATSLLRKRAAAIRAIPTKEG